jgi:hypothetical protein
MELFSITHKAGARDYFFERGLGKGYNAGVIAYRLDLPPTCNKMDRLEDGSLKVKLFDFTDLRDFGALEMFFHRFLQQHGLV